MRTTLDLPEDLLNEALKITNEKNKTSLIVNSIKATIRKHKLSALIEMQGTMPDFDIDLNKTRKRSK